MDLKKIKNISFLQNANLFFALIVSFWIPQYRFTLSFFIALWLVFNILEFNFIQRIKNSISKNNIILFSFQIIFFLIIVAGYFISDNKEYASELIIKKLSFLIFPVLFLFSGNLFKIKKEAFLKVFVLGNIVASVICILHFFYASISYKSGNFIFFPYDEVGNTLYTYTKFSFFHHPAYFSMYLVFSIAILFYLKNNTDFFRPPKRINLFYVIIIFNVFMIILLSSRAGMISLFLLFLWEVFIYINNHKRLIVRVSSLIVVLVSIIVLSQNNRVQRFYNEVSGIYEDGKNSDYYPTRLVLWEAATYVAYEDFWIGAGTGDAIDELAKKVETIHIRADKIKGFNAHNQFLDTFMSSGILGFLVLLSIIILSLAIAIKTKNKLFLIFILLISFNFLFESMLNTIAGIVFFVYFLNYFVFVFNENKKSQITE